MLWREVVDAENDSRYEKQGVLNLLFIVSFDTQRSCLDRGD
jgi:hypothetical protein